MGLPSKWKDNMKIHAEIKTPAASYLVSESHGSGGGRKFGNFVMLRIVRVAADAEYRSVRSNGVEVLEGYEVDSRNTGARSAYGRTLNGLIARLPKAIRSDDTRLAA